MSGNFVMVYIVVMIISSVVAGLIAQGKMRSYYGFLLLGLIFGPLAILVAVLVGPGQAAAPEGMHAVKCPRCNAEQNVPTSGNQEFECWQCRLVSSCR